MWICCCVHGDDAQEKVDFLWLQNIQLGLSRAIVASMNTLSVEYTAVMQGDLLQGFNSATLWLVFTLACGGLLVAMVPKCADNILRQFITALSILITCVVPSLIFGDFTPDLTFQFDHAFFLATFM